jgi:hypothetical protein
VSERDRFEERIGTFQVVVYDDMIMCTGKSSILHLEKSGFKALLNSGSGFCPTADETITQCRQGGWRDETINGVQVGSFDLPDALGRRIRRDI